MVRIGINKVSWQIGKIRTLVHFNMWIELKNQMHFGMRWFNVISRRWKWRETKKNAFLLLFPHFTLLMLETERGHLFECLAEIDCIRIRHSVSLRNIVMKQSKNRWLKFIISVILLRCTVKLIVFWHLFERWDKININKINYYVSILIENYRFIIGCFNCIVLLLVVSISRAAVLAPII